MKKGRLISIIGNVASGKTTSLPLVVKVVGGLAVKADEVFQKDNAFREDYLVDMRRWALANELFVMFERVKLMRSVLGRKLNKPFVVDGGLPMSWVYAYGHFVEGNLSKAEWGLYETLFNDFAGNIFSDSGVIYMGCGVETLLARISKRSRDYELEHYGKEYLDLINKGLDAFGEKLKEHKVPLLSLTEDEVGNLVSNNNDKQNFVKVVSEWWRDKVLG